MKHKTVNILHLDFEAEAPSQRDERRVMPIFGGARRPSLFVEFTRRLSTDNIKRGYYL